MRILAIGNSFSRNACTYLHQAALAQGIDLDVTNLYIGGCPLETHCLNLETGAPDYDLQHNGESTGRMVSIMETLRDGPWDVIITQQASHFSGWMESYEPFLGILADVLRREAPNARLLLHETWAYEHGSPHRFFLRYNRSQQQMYDRLHHCYTAMADKYGFDLIPCGTLIQQTRALPAFDTPSGGQTLCLSDGFHMNLYGCYLLALVWIKTLCGASVAENPFTPAPGFEVDVVDETLLQLIRDVVREG